MTFETTQRRLLLASFVITALALLPSTSTAQCFPTCRTGFVCSPANECVSMCNPPCDAGQICTGQGECTPSPTATTPAPASTPDPAPVQEQVTTDAAPSNAEDAEVARARTAHLTRGGFRLFLGPEFGPPVGVIRRNSFVRDDLGTTFGARVAAHFSFGDHLYAGPAVSFAHFSTERGRGSALALMGLVGFRYAVQTGPVVFEPTGGIALGAALGLELERVTVAGLVVDARVGLNIWFSAGFGGYVNVGYQFHNFFNGDDDAVRINQLRVGTGLAFRLGT